MILLRGGNVKMRLLSPRGELIRQWRAQNLIVDAGEQLLAQLILDDAVTPPSHMAIGDDATPTTSGMTALQGTEHQRVAITASRTGTTVKYSASFTGSGADVDVREAGIFNAGAGGTMLARWNPTEFILIDTFQFDVEWAAEVAGVVEN